MGAPTRQQRRAQPAHRHLHHPPDRDRARRGAAAQFPHRGRHRPTKGTRRLARTRRAQGTRARRRRPPAQDALVRLSYRCFPSYRPMLAEYQLVLDAIGKNKTKDVANRLAELDETRATMTAKAPAPAITSIGSKSPAPAKPAASSTTTCASRSASKPIPTTATTASRNTSTAWTPFSAARAIRRARRRHRRIGLSRDSRAARQPDRISQKIRSGKPKGPIETCSRGDSIFARLKR